MHPTSDTGPTERGSPPYGWALGATLAVALLYILTLSPTTAFWDTSEYIATAHILGIPHPPGNPLFVVLARAWEILLAPLGLSVAVRISLFSATMSALAHGLWFLVIHQILRHFAQDRVFPLVGASVAVLVSATAFSVWNQSNVNEKVYTVSLFTIALLSWLAFHWRENLGRGKDDNLLILMVFILALSVGNHLMAFLAAPALVVFILLVHPRTLLNVRLYVAAVIALFLGLSIHLFLPLRAGLDPIINEASPTCTSLGSALVSILSWGQGGCEALSDALSRKQYVKPPWLSISDRLAPLHLQFANYLQYFDWQWARVVQGSQVVFAGARLPFTLLFTGLGVYGALEHFRRERKSFWYVLALFSTLSVALVYYLNFKYGYTIAEPLNDPGLHEVRERDYFFIVSFSVWGLWAGAGIATLWRRLAGDNPGRYWMAAPVLALAFIPLILNGPRASRAGDYSARDWAYNLLMSVEPYGVIFTNGDNDTFPLWYLQETEGIRKDVTVIVTSYLNIDWYARQLRDLTRPCPPGVDPEDNPTRIICQRPYTSEGSPGAEYTMDPDAVRSAGKVPLLLRTPADRPSRTILQLDDTTIQRVAGAVIPLQEDRTVEMGEVSALLRGGSYVYPWHQYALAIISSSLGDRPVYFASSGNAAGELGLTPYLVRQGLAYRLSPTLPEAGGGITELGLSPLSSVTGLWLDVERSRTLAWEVFLHRGGLPEGREYWPDHAVLGVPNYYAWVHYSLYQVATQNGDQEAADRNLEQAEAWARLGI